MKKSKIFLKSLIGIPMGIFVLEVLNIIISLKYGEYIRLDGLANGINLNNVLLIYVYCSFYSYLMAICVNYPLKAEEMELSIREREKEIRKIGLPVITIMFVIFCVSLIAIPGNYESIFGFCSAALYSFIAILIGMIQNLLNKYKIKQINETLKKAFKE